MPSHTHSVTDPGHTHSYISYVGGSGAGLTAGSNAPSFSTSTGSNTTGISIQNAGSGTAMDFAVQYVDVIICVKD